MGLPQILLSSLSYWVQLSKNACFVEELRLTKLLSVLRMFPVIIIIPKQREVRLHQTAEV